MEVRVVSYKNRYCYLFSKLFVNNEYVCDTLEFGNSTSLKSGNYYMSTEKNTTKGVTEIMIFDELFCKISSVRENNNEFYKGIEMRIKNNVIQVGLESQNCTLKMCSYTFDLLLRKISKAINYSEDIIFLVDRNNIKIENE